MGWGNPTPILDLKRASREVRRITDERDAAVAELATLRETIGDVMETRVEYGHLLPDGSWLREPRGIKYARVQRTVHFRVDEPVILDHWTYTDHRHPIEDCTHDRHDLTTEAAVSARIARGTGGSE